MGDFCESEGYLKNLDPRVVFKDPERQVSALNTRVNLKMVDKADF